MNLEIFTIQQNNTLISFCPERWWLVTSIKINWKEILYFDNETFIDIWKSIRWWIPVMFPNAWPLNDNSLYKLSQHWFARNMKWNYELIWENKFTMFLESDSETREQFDYNFKLEVIWEIISENKIKFTQKITNTWDKILPIATGLHPYFKVKSENKSQIKFNFDWWEIIEKDIQNWSTWWTTFVDNPSEFIVFLPEIWNLKFNYSKNYKRIWIWSQENKDFICIEPCIWDYWCLTDNPTWINSWEELILENTIELI